MGLYLLRGCLESVNATSECTNGGAARLPVYEIASPLFEKITIHLNEDYYAGGAIVIDAVGNGPGNLYVQSAEWNGETLNKAWIPHSQVVKGGTLKLVMGNEPNHAWASAPGSAPPSMTMVESLNREGENHE